MYYYVCVCNSCLGRENARDCLFYHYWWRGAITTIDKDSCNHFCITLFSFILYMQVFIYVTNIKMQWCGWQPAPLPSKKSTISRKETNYMSLSCCCRIFKDFLEIYRRCQFWNLQCHGKMSYRRRFSGSRLFQGQIIVWN